MTGQRIPFVEHTAKGMFFGFTLKHNGASMARAVMEGVTYALRDRMETFKMLGIKIEKIIASGGGVNSSLWLQIQADVFGREIYRSKMQEQVSVGAAMTAGIGCGIYKDMEEACKTIVKIDKNPIEPNQRNVSLYDPYYDIYKSVNERNSI